MIIVAVFYIPTRVGGWGHIFAERAGALEGDQPGDAEAERHVHPHHQQQPARLLHPGSRLRAGPDPLPAHGHRRPVDQAAYIVKRNMALLPIYSILLGLIALLGYMALTDKTTAAKVKKAGNAQLAVPYLFQHMFSSWFAGIAFAAIVIGALVPAAIMAIAAANLFTRNIFTEFFKPDASPRLQTRVAQWASLVVKLGALYSRSSCRKRSPSTCSCSAACGSCSCADAHRRPVHPLVRPLRPAARLAGRHALRHDRGLQGRRPRPCRTGPASVRHRARAHGLHRPSRDDHQPDRLGDPDPHLQGRQDARGRRRDAPARVHG